MFLHVHHSLPFMSANLYCIRMYICICMHENFYHTLIRGNNKFYSLSDVCQMRSKGEWLLKINDLPNNEITLHYHYSFDLFG